MVVVVAFRVVEECDHGASDHSFLQCVIDDSPADSYRVDFSLDSWHDQIYPTHEDRSACLMRMLEQARAACEHDPSKQPVTRQQSISWVMTASATENERVFYSIKAHLYDNILRKFSRSNVGSGNSEFDPQDRSGKIVDEECQKWCVEICQQKIIKPILKWAEMEKNIILNKSY